MKKLLRYMRAYVKECILGPLFKLLEASFELIVPLVMAAVIDKGIPAGDTDFITKMCLILVTLGVVGLVCSITAQFFAAKAAVGFATNLRQAMFRHIQSLRFSTMDQAGTSTLITRITSDINQVQNCVNMTLRLFLRSPFVVLGAMVMAFTVDVRAAWSFVAVIPLLCVVIFGIMYWTMPRYRRVQTGLDGILEATRENLTGVRVIRAFGREQAEIDRFAAENEKLTGMQIFVGRVSGLMNPLTYIIVNLGTVALLWIGGNRVNTGALTQGQVIALVNYMAQILVELIKLANLIVSMTKSLACANRVADVLDMPAAEAVADGNSQARNTGAVTFDHVSFTYPGAGGEALTDIHFSVRPGQTVGIIGGTGSGKTSLVNLIPRFYDAAEGSITVGDEDVCRWLPDKLRATIGVVPQKAVLFSGTIRENLLWGNENASEQELWEALEVAQAKEFVEKKPQGLDSPVAQGGKNFSGGQRQRLTIARALVRKPAILILDDSASALDLATELRLRTAIRHLPNSPTTFIVSQRVSSIRHADQILVLDDGQAVGIGTHTQLMQSCQVYQEICQSQLGKEEA